MIIYKIINKINGKIYIGQTTNVNPEKRIKAHFKKTRSRDLVRDAANKYGKDSLEWEILYCALDQEELDRAEKYFIEQYKSLVPNGYNIQQGGNGKGKWSEQSKKENGILVKQWYKNNSHPFKNKKFSKEHIEALSKVRKGFNSSARMEAAAKRRKIIVERQKNNIVAINIQTGEEYIFDCIASCAKTLNLEAGSISRVLRAKEGRIQHKGYKFRYLYKENNQLNKKPDRELKYISIINKGGYAIKVLSKYLGWTKSLEEAKQIRDEYLKSLDKGE